MLRLASIAFAESQYTTISSVPSSSVLPTSEITKELPAGTGILLAIDTETAVLWSLTSTVKLTELSVLLAKVPPIRILFVADAEVYAVVGPRNLTF